MSAETLTKKGQGPLAGVRIVELGGIAPGPFAAMLLSDLGVDVLRIDRIVASDSGVDTPPKFNLLHPGRRSVAMDLKKPEAVDAVRMLVGKADALIEGFRPGVAERLGLGPDDCWAANPKLVCGRMTGWGLEGPLAQAPGDDLNYIALTGVLHSVGSRGGPPVPRLNLAGDFGGGALYLALGIVSALLEARSGGRGQVVDAAMMDGSASLMTLMYRMRAAGAWIDHRGSNRLDFGAPWYSVYETGDGRYVALASNEPRFYAVSFKLMGLNPAELPDQDDTRSWPEMNALFAKVFKTRTRDEWCNLMDGEEVYFAPVLSMAEAPEQPYLKARGTFVEVHGVVQPAPAPRFSRTPGAIQPGASHPGKHTDEGLADWGFAAAELTSMRDVGAIRAARPWPGRRHGRPGSELGTRLQPLAVFGHGQRQEHRSARGGQARCGADQQWRQRCPRPRTAAAPRRPMTRPDRIAGRGAFLQHRVSTMAERSPCVPSAMPIEI